MTRRDIEDGLDRLENVLCGEKISQELRQEIFHFAASIAAGLEEETLKLTERGIHSRFFRPSKN